jgi:hypothetical protein
MITESVKVPLVKQYNEVADTLAKDKTFKLSGKKVLKEASDTMQYVVVEVTESPIQRPKENKKSTIRGKRSVIR